MLKNVKLLFLMLRKGLINAEMTVLLYQKLLYLLLIFVKMFVTQNILIILMEFALSNVIQTNQLFQMISMLKNVKQQDIHIYIRKTALVLQIVEQQIKFSP